MDIAKAMKKAVQCYDTIDTIGEELAKIITAQIEPLMIEKKYQEAKGAVKAFYEPSRYKTKDSDGLGDVIFIEHDMIIANINRKMRKELGYIN